MKKMILGVGVTLVGLLLMAGLASAEIPHLINFQGRLTDASGAPVPDGTPIKFSIYNDPVVVGALWSETHPSDSDPNGIFNVLLGSATTGGIPSTVFEEKDRYLGIKVGTDPEMTPRQRITSVGYAFNADRVKGSNIFPSSGNVGIGTTSPAGILDVRAITPQVWISNRGVTGASGEAELRFQRYNWGNYFTMRTHPTQNAIVIGSNPGGPYSDLVTIETYGNVGIGTTNPNAKLMVDNYSIWPAPAGLALDVQDRNAAARIVGGPVAWIPSGHGANAILSVYNSDQGNNIPVLDVGTNLGVAFITDAQTYTTFYGGHGNASSKRWKTNIQPIEGALAKVERLKGVYFNWKETGEYDIGMVAEEVGEVIPEVVAYEENGKDAKALSYDKLVPVLVEAIKEQQQKISALEKEVAKLERKIDK